MGVSIEEGEHRPWFENGETHTECSHWGVVMKKTLFSLALYCSICVGFANGQTITTVTPTYGGGSTIYTTERQPVTVTPTYGGGVTVYDPNR